MRFEKTDSVLWPKHLSAMPAVLEALREATQDRPCALNVDGTVVEFVPMNGAEGFKAVGAGKRFWNKIPYRQWLSLRLKHPGEAGMIAAAAASPAEHREPGRTSASPISKPSLPRQSIAPENEEWPSALSLPSGRITDFDAYVIVDWSASQKKYNVGKHSVWWVCAHWERGRITFEPPSNPSTRALAREQIRKHLQKLVREKRSVLLAFDFAYGYPAGLGRKLGLAGKQPWREVWQELARLIVDRQGFNNRCEIAAQFNLNMGGSGPFWGCRHNTVPDGLTRNKPPFPWPLPEFRVVERRARRAKSAFHLAGNGSVGGQVLMGLPTLEWLRSHSDFEAISTVWPFETGAVLPPRPEGARIVHAEIYPSLVTHPIPAGWCNDQAQVVAVAHWLASLDAGGHLSSYFEAPGGNGREILEEEGWILGVR